MIRKTILAAMICTTLVGCSVFAEEAQTETEDDVILAEIVNRHD